MAALKRSIRQDWSRRVEAATASANLALLAEGRLGYSKLSFGERLNLCREIVETRRRELCIAYDNVVMVTAALKAARSPRTGKRKVGKEPCVVFFVRRKWPRGMAAKNLQLIPAELLAYAGSGPNRAICSVPTDVVSEKQVFDSELQASTGINVTRGGSEFFANVTCAVRVTLDGKPRDMMLSCLHVFSPYPAADISPPEGGTPISRGDKEGAPAFGVSAPLGGSAWSNEKDPSFDAQLADIGKKSGDLAALKRALGGMALSPTRPFLRNRDEFNTCLETIRSTNAKIRILVSPYNSDDGQPVHRDVTVDYLGDHSETDLWDFHATVNKKRDTIHILQLRLMDMNFTGDPTTRGDSGSPVVTDAGDGLTLIGMHIAGAPDHSVMMPAWQLFDPFNYGPRVTAIRPINP